ncbi:hypothetical protein RBQ08_RS03270 [Enterobacter hormaechei]
MITLTKEWLLTTIAELEEERDAVPGAVNEDALMALAAMKIALASLEAESVAFRSKLKPPSSIGSEHWDYTDHRQPDAFELEGCVIERLFTEPPAPVAVPDELEKAQRMESYWKTQCRGITDHCEELQSRVAELSSHKAALLKFIRDSCYVFDGADEDISDAYVDAITSGIMPKLEAVAACNPPLFWVRVKSDGGYDGPIHDSKLEDVRKKSGEWLPLTLACVDASRQPSEVSCRAAMLQGAEPVTTANKLPFEQWLSQQTGTIDVECGCVMTEVFFHWLRVAYEAGNYPVIPDGWVLVPIEPTYQMCEAMGLQWESPRFPDRYKAMLAAVKK